LFSSFVLIGDFNVNFLDNTHPGFSFVSDILCSFNLTQVCPGPTCIATNGSCTMIDLALVSEPCSAQVIPPLSNSDHNGIFLNLKCQSTRFNTPTKRRPIWKYKLANFEAANEILSNVDWNSLLDDDINQAWYNWQAQFLLVMEDCIPKGMLPKRKQPPWITKQIRSAICKWNQLYRRSRV